MERQPRPGGDALIHHQLFKPGTALANGVAISAKIPIAGAGQLRFYLKASVASTVDYYFLRPDASARYDTVAEAQDAGVANTELAADITARGEAWLEIEITPGDDGVLEYADLALIQGV